MFIFFSKTMKSQYAIMLNVYFFFLIVTAGYAIAKQKNDTSKSSRSNSTKALTGKKPHWLNPKRMKKILHAEPAGNTVKFTCLATGNEPLKAKWYKNGTSLITKDQRIGGYKFQKHNQVITLESVVLSDRAKYTCVISNDYGSINHTYELDVAERSAHRPILVIEPPANKTAFVGEDVRFKCNVYSDPHPHIQWLKYNLQDGRNKSNSRNGEVLKKAGVNTTNDDMKVLTIRNVTFEDQAEYSCMAGNAIGISHVSGFLKVIPEPHPTSIPPDRPTKPYYYLFAGIGAFILLTFIIYLIYNNKFQKGTPSLVPIENPDKIPPMTKLEEPLMAISNEQAWKRMGHIDHIEINIQPDLQWELKQKNIHLLERIDEGFFGQVFKAGLIRCVNGKEEKVEAAVKMLKPSRSEKDMLDLLSEMDQMKRVGKHKNIISLLGVCTQNGVLWLVTEYAQQGNLRDYLRRNRPVEMQYHPVDPNGPDPKSTPLTEKDLMSAAYQVARGMEYLAQKKCIHRDLAARNVLVTNEYVMKIADFGLARDIRLHDYYRKHTRGHLPYKWMALEAMTDNVFTHATDVWSFGVLLWEIFSLGGSPYPGVKTHELVRLLRQNERLDQPPLASPELYRLMRDCWEEMPQKRPKFRQLVEDLDRMLVKSSSLEYIDLNHPFDGKFTASDSEESGIDDEGESSRDSAHVTGEDTDSVFEATDHGYLLAEADERDDDQPLLPNGDSEVICNEHSRLRSDI